ncbi:MFS transporter [Chryseobacterium soli]|uniref:MFS transporter n=1 Tax=Chryseobacterium soli TaxID=445961 RepID=UPI0029537CAF|nr:MFS transporter [Chryseobacterium soli]MDV7698310.1 MFS transporter [Chryseobacterium soli]
MTTNAQKLRKLLPLFIIQFFTWLGLFSMWIYSVPVVAKYVFKVANNEQNFENATFWVGIYFSLYSILGTSIAFLLHRYIKKYNAYLLHSIALLIGSFGLISIYFFASPIALLLSFGLIGVGWSSISTIPYLMVEKISKDEEDADKYYAIFNFSTVIPQVVAAFLLAFLTRNYFSGETNKTIFLGGIFMLIAAGICFGIFFKKKN